MMFNNINGYIYIYIYKIYCVNLNTAAVYILAWLDKPKPKQASLSLLFILVCPILAMVLIECWRQSVKKNKGHIICEEGKLCISLN
jgi:hypothetical protein